MNEPVPASRLESLGYQPTFRRVLSRWDLILYGLVILTPTAPYPVYGIVQHALTGARRAGLPGSDGGHAVHRRELRQDVGRVSAAGSTYTYAGQALNEHVGFLAGWAMILDYFLIPLLSIIYCALTAERLLPQVPYIVWALAGHRRRSRP